jgi:putative transcriptional regulator
LQLTIAQFIIAIKEKEVGLLVDLLAKREAAGLSQEELGRKLGISRQAVSMLEIGKNTPKVTTAKKLGEILGFDWTELFNDKVHS